MKIDFKSLRDPSTFPLPKQTVFEGKVLDEIHVQMRERLKEYNSGRKTDGGEQR